ncbi:hypothetical protein DCC85_19805 [Paenibacillus sp. CAA11]|uniref:HAD family hydrolase n=1 Tax=Paenibacillus sp. CAA11 TaxID=1532905 RepID=UPI000D3A208A|nr:HAD family hydrolase [Paenibacillus sp. CAA11]AWB46184.1 hypothetical protein DCC85_19805 [Paenibacillus sp. CAA11]
MIFEEVSFDIYQKYKVIEDYVNSFRHHKESFKILEVGGRDSWLPKLLPSDTVYCLDTEVLSGENFILGNALNMPFEDNEFDFVVSADVLEHIQNNDREKFILEHARCAKIASMIIAPHYSKQASLEEKDILEKYKQMSGGESYRWLDEHNENGLPISRAMEDILNKGNLNYKMTFMGWLPLWNFMLNLSHHIVFFNWKYENVYKRFNQLNKFYNQQISKYDWNPSEDGSYRMIITIYKEAEIPSELQECYSIKDLPLEVWSQFSHLYWDLITELNIAKDSVAQELQQINLEDRQEKNKLNQYVLEMQMKIKGITAELEGMKKQLKIQFEEKNQIAEELVEEKEKTADLKDELMQKNKRVAHLKDEIMEKDERVADLKDELERTRAQLIERDRNIEYLRHTQQLYDQSTSWKITRPLRYMGAKAKLVKKVPKRAAKKAVVVMEHLKAKKVHKLTELLTMDLNKYSTISFDMFDTLVFRTVEPPELVHKLTAEFIYNILVREGVYHLNVDQILNTRYELEWVLRSEQLNKGLDLECCFNDLMELYLNRLNGEEFSDKYIKEVKEFEVNSELSVLYTNPEALEVLEKLKALGKKIIVISDMYLEKDVLQRILDNCGLLNHIDDLFVSNTFNLSKGSGRLFQKLAELEHIQLEDILHTGDNFVSDYKMPRKIGVDAVWYYSKENLNRRNRISKELQNGNIVEFLRQKKNPSKDKENLNEFYQLGFEILGPIFTNYIDGLINLVIQKKMTNIFFLAREGYLFIQVYERLKKVKKYSLNELPEGTYMYISRLSSSLPSVYRFGIREIRMGLWKIDPKGLYSILKTFNLNPEDFEEYAKVYGFGHMQEPIYDPLNDIRLHNFIDDYRVQKLIEAQKETEIDLLKKYLTQLGFFGLRKKAVFVDIGWSGTIQHNIGRAFIDDEYFPHLFGYYFGRNFDYHLRYLMHPKLLFEPGYSYDFEHFKETDFITEFPQLFEQAATAPHGSTIGYEEKEGRIIPVLKQEGEDRKTEEKQNYIIQQIQKGILDYVDEFVELNNSVYLDYNAVKKTALDSVERFIRNPRPAEVRIFEQLNHSEDWGASNSLQLVAKNIGWTTLFSKNRMKSKLGQAFWKQGSLVNSKIPGLVHLYNYWRKKRKK